MAPDLGVGRRLRRPIERCGHVQRQLFAADRIDRRIGNLRTDDRQMPRQLGLAQRRRPLRPRRDRRPHNPAPGPLP